MRSTSVPFTAHHLNHRLAEQGFMNSSSIQVEWELQRSWRASQTSVVSGWSSSAPLRRGGCSVAAPSLFFCSSHRDLMATERSGAKKWETGWRAKTAQWLVVDTESFLLKVMDKDGWEEGMYAQNRILGPFFGFASSEWSVAREAETPGMAFSTEGSSLQAQSDWISVWTRSVAQSSSCGLVSATASTLLTSSDFQPTPQPSFLEGSLGSGSDYQTSRASCKEHSEESRSPMEEQRPRKRPRTVAPDPASEGDPRESDHPNVEFEDLGEADGPAESGQPKKPIAYVNPMRFEVPVRTEPAGPTQRGRIQRRPQQAERAHTQGQGRRAGRHRHWETDSREQLERSQEPVHGQLVGQEEPGHRVDPEASWTSAFSFITASTVREDELLGRSSHSNQLAGAIREPPPVSGYWAVTGRQISAIYPYIGFIPLFGSSLYFVETPFGTHVFGVPVFFTNIAH
ncbi:proline-rich protein 20G [Fukomys damarensis]|uniref:proline-rich protein 20G n=1 Tax=Fukomys damarensis TaxID=885580 RepID=UPI0008FED066|nr:proline-rich protein 20G [Fukomys damarensis]